MRFPVVATVLASISVSALVGGVWSLLAITAAITGLFVGTLDLVKG